MQIAHAATATTSPRLPPTVTNQAAGYRPTFKKYLTTVVYTIDVVTYCLKFIWYMIILCSYKSMSTKNVIIYYA